MAKNLVAKNGTVVHAPATTGTGPRCSNMRRDHRATLEIQVASFSPTDAPVTCKDCCRILGIEAPKATPGAKRTKPALDSFEVGQRIVYMVVGGEASYAKIVKLTASLVSFVTEGPDSYRGAIARTQARKLNG